MPMRTLTTALLAGAAMLGAMPAAAATRDFPARGFDKVELRSAATVTIVTGRNFSVHADGDPRLVQRMTADVRNNGTLVIDWQRGESMHIENEHLHVTVTMPRVAGAAIAGAGTITVDRVDAPGFAADVSGAGTIRVATLRTDRTLLAMGGTGQIVVSGRTARLDARVSGVGTIDAGNLEAAGGALAMSGTGHIGARVNGPADVTLSGMGSVVVTGTPRCSVHKSGLGSVRCC
jgi:hypothetical protein